MERKYDFNESTNRQRNWNRNNDEMLWKVLKSAYNADGFKQFDILQMKKDRNAKWQIALKPMLTAVFSKGVAVK